MRGRAILGALGATALALGSMLAAPLAAPSTAGAAPAATTPLPLATSVPTAQGTWATVAMGRLDQPLNTFWQLFYQPAGSTSWTNQVEATATATNGGLVLGSDAAALVVGVRPSNELRYSPLITSSDGGRSWSNGLLFQGLVAAPDALALAPGQAPVALVTGRRGTEVEVASGGGISRWRNLVSQEALARQPVAQDCGVVALDAVGYDTAGPLVGAACTRPGLVGLFQRQGGDWRAVGPRLPPSLAQGPVTVLALSSAGPDLGLVLRVTRPSGSAIVVAWMPEGQTGWQLSPALSLGPAGHLVSVGPTGGGFFVLSSRAGKSQLSTLEGPGTTWTSMPSPPAGTATVAFAPGDTQALSVHGSVLVVWTLGTAGWTVGQRLRVPIQYGSSS